jgi:predicted anti-sigma-YlaC factor YlaD
MIATASICLLDTGGIPASVAAGAAQTVALGSVLGALVVVMIACLCAIGYHDRQAERERVDRRASAPAPAIVPGRGLSRRGRRGRPRATPLRALARAAAR